MGGFRSLPQAIDPGEQQTPILPEEVKPAGEAWDDETALGIVLADVSSTLSYYQSKGLTPLGVENADDLVRGYVRPRQWPDGKPRANLSMHVSLQAIEKIMPSLYMSLFPPGKKMPFVVEAVGKTKPEAARANASLLWWGMKRSDLKEEMRISLKSALTYGPTFGVWGWETKTVRKKVYAKTSDGKMKGTQKEIDWECPKYESVDPRYFGYDPTLRRQDVRKGKFYFRQVMTNGYGLDELRDDPSYKNIPTNEELAEILSRKSEPTEDSLKDNKRAVWREFQAKLDTEDASKDPMMHPLEILEYVTDDRVVAILQRKITIRNEENEFGRKNAVSCSFIDVLGSCWGFGIPKLIAGEQRLQQGVVNTWIDSLALVLNPVYQLLKGVGPGTQTIPVSPGKVITESGELKPLVTPDVTGPAMEAIAGSDARASQKVGANGPSDAPTQALRTGKGVDAFASDFIQRLQYFLEQFINLVYIPVLEAYLEIIHDHLTEEQINEILTEEEGKAYEGDITDVYNADLRVDVIAGANMMAKFAASQLAPMIIQLVSAGPVADQFEVAAKKFNYVEFVSETVDLMGWDLEHLIEDMTDEDKQRVKDKNQAMSRGIAAQQLQAQKAGDTLNQIDAKASGQAGVAVVRQILKTHSDAAMAAVEQGQGSDNGQQ